MSKPYIVDAHVHFGYPNSFFTPETQPEELVAWMDNLSIDISLVCGDMVALATDPMRGIEIAQQAYENSGGRLPFLGAYHPDKPDASIEAFRKAQKSDGFKGIKVHPVFHKTVAEDPAYEPAWRFVADNDLSIMSHTWSVSSYNPGQVYALPDRFEKWIKMFPSVRFVLAHSGGRGNGRFQAIRLVNEYENVYMDMGGDIYCYEYFERMTKLVPVHKILFGSDWPWFDQRSQLTRVFLADIDEDTKRMILRDNALAVYRLT